MPRPVGRARAQTNLTLDPEFLRVAQSAARFEGVSLSRWLERTAAIKLRKLAGHLIATEPDHMVAAAIEEWTERPADSLPTCPLCAPVEPNGCQICSFLRGKLASPWHTPWPEARAERTVVRAWFEAFEAEAPGRFTYAESQMETEAEAAASREARRQGANAAADARRAGGGR